jgi:hypothetical protein
MHATRLGHLIIHLGFEVLTEVVMKVAIFWYRASCSPYVNRRFGDTYHLLLQDRKSAERETSVQQMARQNLDPEDRGNTALRNVGSHTDYTALYLKAGKHS